MPGKKTDEKQKEAVELDERRLIREGVISEVNAERLTVRVTFEDRDALVSGELPILTRGSSDPAEYWLPKVGETGVCIFAPNDEDSGQGWLLGTRYNEKNPPSKAGGRRLTFADGTELEIIDGNVNLTITGNFTLAVKGTVKITGEKILLND